MLQHIRRELGRRYVDSTYRGIHMGPVFDAAEQYVETAARSLEDVFGAITLALLPPNDSHNPRTGLLDAGPCAI